MHCILALFFLSKMNVFMQADTSCRGFCWTDPLIVDSADVRFAQSTTVTERSGFVLQGQVSCHLLNLIVWSSFLTEIMLLLPYAELLSAWPAVSQRVFSFPDLTGDRKISILQLSLYLVLWLLFWPPFLQKFAHTKPAWEYGCNPFLLYAQANSTFCC